MHESPDSENDADKQHNDEEDQEVEESASHVSERGMIVPSGKHEIPGLIGNTIFADSFLEMSMWGDVGSVDEISSFPDQDDGNEKSD